MFTVNRKQLESELALLQGVAEKKTTIPALSTVLFSFDGETLTLTASDIDTTIITEIPATGEAWSGCIPSRQLYDLMRLCSGDEVKIIPQDGRAMIKWDRSSHKLPTLPASAFPDVHCPDVSLVKTDGMALSKALERGLRCVSTDAKESWMHGVSLRTIDGLLYVAATNSRHFAVTTIPLDTDLDVLIPVKAATSLVKFLSGEVELGSTENQVVFRQGPKVFTARLADAKFPDWRPLIPANFKHSLMLDSEVTRQAFKLAAVTARETALIQIPIRLSVTQKEITIQTEESERGHSTELIAIDCPSLNGDNLSRGVNGGHFLGFLEEDTKAIMSFNDDMRIIQLGYEGQPEYRYITMALKA